MKPLKVEDIIGGPYREVHMWYGRPDAGKSTRILEVASLHPANKMAVIDGDGRFRKVWRDGWPGVSNIAYYPVRNWAETKDAYDDAKGWLKKGDWLVLEMVDKYWDFAYGHYYQVVRGKSMDELLLELKKNTKTAKGLADPDSITTVRIVKQMHNTNFLDEATSFLECHIILTAAAQPLLIEFDGKEVKDLFGGLGWKPDGEKRNAYRVDTCIYFDIDLEGGAGTRYWSTVKDKERPRAWRQEFDGKKRAWWLDYEDFVKESNSPVRTR